MTKRMEDLLAHKARALTGDMHRLGLEAERWNGQLRDIRSVHRRAVESFESVRHRTRETGEVTDPRIGRFYVEALRERLVVERGAVRRLEERLTDAELRISTVHQEMSSTLGRLKRLHEVTRELQRKGTADRERRAEELRHDVWLGNDRRGQDGLDGSDKDPIVLDDRCVIPGTEVRRLVDDSGIVAAGVEQTALFEPVSSTSGGIEDRKVCCRSGRFELDVEGAASPGGSPPGTASSGGLSVGGLIQEAVGRSSQPRAPESSAPTTLSRSRPPVPLTTAAGTVSEIEHRPDGGLSLTYRGASGSAIGVGLTQVRNGAIEIALTAERPGDRHRLERERRGLVESLRERGYRVERLSISVSRQEVAEDGVR